MKTISVRQPWAWLIIYGGKDIENRDWPTRYCGPLAIHAAKGMTVQEYEDSYDFVNSFDRRLASKIPAFPELVRGAVIGTVILHDCVTADGSNWFQGIYGFILTDPKPMDPVFVKGALGLWEWTPELPNEGE